MTDVLGSPRPLREVLVRAVGDLDLHSAASLQESLDRACAQAPALVVLDLSHVDFMDCSVLKPVLAAREHMRASGGDLVVRDCPPRCRRVLALTGLLDLLEDGPPADPTKGTPPPVPPQNTRS